MMKNKYRIIAVTLVLLSGSWLLAKDDTDSVSSNIPDQKEKFHIFLLMGQSNMSGYAQILPEDKKPVSRVMMLPTVGEVKWVPAAHPLHNRKKSDRFGLGLPFAEEYLKDKPDVVVGLIPVASGGTEIDKLKKETPIYADAIKKAEYAAEHGVIKGVLWHQGEAEIKEPALTKSYEQKLHQLITDLRKDLNNDALPFIAGDLAEFLGTGKGQKQPDKLERIKAVRATLRALPTKVKNTGFVESTGCTSEDKEMVHFDRKSYILLGKRYAEAYSAMMNDGKKSP